MSDVEPNQLTYREHEVQKYARQKQYDLKADVEEAVRMCGIALHNGRPVDYIFTARVCNDLLVPALVKDPLFEIDDRMHDHERWDYEHLHLFTTKPNKWLTALNENPDNRQFARVEGGIEYGNPHFERAKQVVRGAFESLEAIAEEDGVIKGSLKDAAEARGYATQLGVHLSGYDLDLGDPVNLVDTHPEQYLKTLHFGGTNAGKSTGVDTEVWDEYKRDDTVVVDIGDLVQGENYTYDVPQKQDILREARQEIMGHPDFGDDDPPNIKIWVPLTPGLAHEELPYDTEDDRFEVRPFTVPASDMGEEILIKLILSQLTPTEETTVRNLVAEFNRNHDDWTIPDLTKRVRDGEELGEEKQARVVGVLSYLHDTGFIRSHDCQHTIDWQEIYHDTDAIHVFSGQYFDRLSDKLALVAYLLHAATDKRQGLASTAPDMTLVMRELWRLAPHGRRQAGDSRAAALQEAIADTLAAVMREGRHYTTSLIADVQHPKDLHIAVRELFNRFVIYDTGRSTLKEVFDWTGQAGWESCFHSLTKRAGEATIVGQTDVAKNRKGISYIGPVRLAPPPFHHFSVSSDGSGDEARANYLDHVELRVPAEEDGVEWVDDAEIPDDLEMDDSDAVERSPYEEFVYAAIEFTGDRDNHAFNEDVRDAYRQFAADTGAPEIKNNKSFGKQLKAALVSEYDELEKTEEIDNHQRTRDGEQEQAYIEFRLTEKAEHLRDRWRGIEDE